MQQFLIIGCFLLALCLPSIRAHAQDAPRGTSYLYQGTRLLLLGFKAEEDTQAIVNRQAVNRAGGPVGRRRSSKVIVNSRGKPMMFRVGERAGHRVKVRMGKKRVRIWANRGTWYARPTSLSVSQDHVPKPTAAFLASDDILLAPGMRFRSGQGGSRLLVGRTMGFEAGHGVRIPSSGALVVVARGNVPAVRVTLTERVGVKSLRYYDYPLVITNRLRRYIIPFAAFQSRDLRRGRKPKSMHSVTLQTFERAKRGDEVEIDLVALRQKSPRIAAVHRTKRRVRLRWAGKAAAARVGWIDTQGKQHARAARNGIRLPNTATGVWLCHGHGRQGGCCPADAPSTRVAPPPLPGEPLVVDDFDGLAPVDPFRKPHLVFASDPTLQQTMRAKRTGKSLILGYTPSNASDYVGVRVTLPRKLSRKYQTLELVLRSHLTPNAVAVGLRDVRGKEPKVRLGAYVEALGGQTWTTVRIPLAAFKVRALGFADRRPLAKLAAISIALEVSTTSTEHQLEIDRIRLINESAPLTVARFDGMPGQTDLSGAITNESRFGAALSTSTAQGYRGTGLKVEVSKVGGKAYGLVSLGLRRLNAKRYKELSFWIRGASGGETPSITLKDRRRARVKGRIPISSITPISTAWQRVRIPLKSFRRRVRLSDLRAILVSWEDQTVEKQTIYLDEFVLR